LFLLFDCVKNKKLNDPIPKKYRAVIKLLSMSEPTYDDLRRFRDQIHDMIHKQDLSPKQIQDMLCLHYTDFGMFIKRCLGIRLKTSSQANEITARRLGRKVSTEKRQYQKQCEFTFDPYLYPSIPGYELLLQCGMFHPKTNPDGVCRDHMVSKEYGWRNKISPEVISSVYNCQYLLHSENIQKGTSCCITVEQLNDRIMWNNFQKMSNDFIYLTKTSEHKMKISQTLSTYICVTDGTRNIKIPKNQPIPDGFRRGMTRKKNMVGAVGLEPTT
jgi:hypothetical protein